MKQVTLNIYMLSELSETAKKKAIETYKEDNSEYLGTVWQDENFKCIVSVLDHFGCKLSKYDFDYYNASNAYFVVDYPDIVTDSLTLVDFIKGTNLEKYLKEGYKDCIVTGYCLEYDMLDEANLQVTFKEFIEGITHKGFKAIEVDYNYQHSDEYIADEIEADDLYFLEDGTRYQHQLDVDEI